MAIQHFEDARHLRAYCERLGRVGMTAEIVELAKAIVANPEHGQEVMRNAGKIRALCVGAKADHYWDEKQGIGYNDMIEHAKRDNRQACDHDWAGKRVAHDGRTIQECKKRCGVSLITEPDGKTWLGA